ncbi:MAG: hypothetical protein NUV50_10815 [Rhodospirillales bacterium]|nr:hypothetical protein [Rhodospirillales bacterium]
MAITRSRLPILKAFPYYFFYNKCTSRYSSNGPQIAFPENHNEYMEKGFTALKTAESQRLLTSLDDRIRSLEATGEMVYGTNALFEEGWNKFPEVELLFQGVLGDLIRSVLNSDFKIYICGFHQKIGDPEGANRKLWHSDSGPGTCLNIFCYLSDASAETGPTTLLPWKASLDIFRAEWDFVDQFLNEHGRKTVTSEELRVARHNFYECLIRERYADQVATPSGTTGLIALFNNNILHSAKPTAPGSSRRVMLCRVYPSDKPFDLDGYKDRGVLLKRLPKYPRASDIF